MSDKASTRGHSKATSDNSAHEHMMQSLISKGWSGGAMVLGKIQCWGVLLIWIIVGQGPTALTVGAGCLDTFSLTIISLFFLPLSGRRPDID